MPGDQHEDAGCSGIRVAAWSGERAAGDELPEQEGDRDQHGEDDQRHPADRDVALDQRQHLAAAALLRGGERALDAADDRAEQLEQGPDRGDADHAGAEEAHVGAEDGVGDLLGRARQRRAVRIGSRIHQAMTRPSSIAMPTEMPTRWPAPTSAKERPPESRSTAGADMEETGDLLGQQPGLARRA